MCLVETDPQMQRTQTRIGMVTVVPSTGDVIYDSFEDGPLRMELETRLTHLRPHELLVSGCGLSSESDAVLKQFTRDG